MAAGVESKVLVHGFGRLSNWLGRSGRAYAGACPQPEPFLAGYQRGRELNDLSRRLAEVKQELAAVPDLLRDIQTKAYRLQGLQDRQKTEKFKGQQNAETYIRDIGAQLLRTQGADGAWVEGHVGPVYTTAINATILQLDKGYLPIYQR